MSVSVRRGEARRGVIIGRQIATGNFLANHVHVHEVQVDSQKKLLKEGAAAALQICHKASPTWYKVGGTASFGSYSQSSDLSLPSPPPRDGTQTQTECGGSLSRLEVVIEIRRVLPIGDLMNREWRGQLKFPVKGL